MNLFSTHYRNYLIECLADKKYDVIIIGGGITGAGIALDAASRGLKVALIEKKDFASGTSSRSTKLIHGGLRYLKQFEIALVREVGRERAMVHKLAPHLVSAEKMLIPITKEGTFGKMSTSLGLFVYDVLAGVEKEDQRLMLSLEESIEQEVLLSQLKGLESSGLYAEYRTDDARLTLEVLKTADQNGANCINYMKMDDFVYKNGKIIGITCTDKLTNKQITIRGKYVVSATGPWVDNLRKKNNSLNHKRLQLSKGVHLVFKRERFPINQALYFDVSDGRMIFAIPRGKTTYVGTTDTPYVGKINQVKTKQEDVDYLLNAVNENFPKLKLNARDVISNWAGLRPLIYEEGKDTSELSRKDEIFESETGLISIAGGKLTGYRNMADRLVDLVYEHYAKAQGTKFKKCRTHKIVLTGGVFKKEKSVKKYIKKIIRQMSAYGFEEHDVEYLVHNYGRQSQFILVKFKELIEQELGQNPVKERQTALARAELWFGVENEMVALPMDFFQRRTGRYYFDIDSVKNTYRAILLDFQNYFSWDEQQLTEQIQEMEQHIYLASNFE
jgi:glycerol-3-phosphate dehydrogenase